jgi:N-acyl-D-amino-acid deacylase
VRRSDGLTWAVLFNASQDPRGKNLADQIDPLVHKAADEVRHWPDEDLFGEFLRPR